MNPTTIITVYVIIDDTLKALGHVSDKRAVTSDAEILFIAVVAALYFQNHHERTLCILRQLGYLPMQLSISRFNRRIHTLEEWLAIILQVLTEVARDGETFIIDSMPLPICKRVRAGRCKKASGRGYCGYCAAKKEKFYGYRLHLVCDRTGLPVTFVIWPAAVHDLAPAENLLAHLPSGARVAADKAYISRLLQASILAKTGVRLVAAHRSNMRPNTPEDTAFIRSTRRTIETVNSQLQAMGVQHLRARTVIGFLIKVQASLLAVACAKFI